MVRGRLNVLVIVGLLLVSLPFVFAIDDLISLQGNVDQSGVAVPSGNVTVTIYDALSGGDMIYNSTTDYNGAIINGKYDILVGNGSNDLSLAFGQKYYMALHIQSEQKFYCQCMTTNIFAVCSVVPFPIYRLENQQLPLFQ